MTAKVDKSCADDAARNDLYGPFQSPMRAILLWISIALCLVFVQPVFSHPIPEGVIFRGIQVVVWAQRIEVRYQLGLSDNMIRQELRALLGEDVSIPEDSGKALRVYRDEMFPRLPDKLSVTIDQRPQELSLRRADVIRQHHIQIELVYRIDFEVPAEPVYFLLVDDNFRGTPGYHLAAIRSRGLVDIPEASAVPVLSRLSRDPETEEELRILSTPVRRIEAMMTAIEPEPLTPPVDEVLASTTKLSDSPSGQPPSAESQADSTPSADRPPPEPAPVLTQDSAQTPASVPSSSIGKTAHVTGADQPPWIWPTVGSILMLIAIIWMLVIARRS